MAKKTTNKNVKEETTTENRKGSNNGGRNKNGNRSSDKKTDTKSKTEGTVSVSSALLDAAANISFPTTSGFPVDLAVDVSDGIEVDPSATRSAQVRIPGVMRLGYVPVMGKMRSWSDAFNVWIRRAFTYIRHANSGSSNYQCVDLGKYFLLWRSCRDFLLWMERLVGVMSGTYIPENAYTPRTLVQAMGVNYEEMILNIPALRFYLTSFGARLYQMKVPNLNYFTTGSALINNVYADCDSPKASFYVFDPDGYWRYHIGDTAEDTYMYLASFKNFGSIGIADIKQMGENLLNDLLNSEDFNLMSGDIVKAYSEYGTVPMIDEKYVVTPIYDAGVLWAIHNSNTLHSARVKAIATISKWRIFENVNSQDSGVVGSLNSNFPVIYGSTVESRDAGLLVPNTFRHLIDLPQATPDASTVGFVTRFMSHLTKAADQSEYGEFELVTCQSEAITSRTVYANPFTEEEVNGDYDNAGVISAFDMHPYLYDSLGVNSSVGRMIVKMYNSPLGEVTNITCIDGKIKENIDMAVMLGVFSMT